MCRVYSCPVLTRFAPSPTGHLHLGHVFAAKYAYDLAMEHGGEFLLRFEDIDTTRVREPYYEGIERDLRWLGMDWSGMPLKQLDRLSAYDEALEVLKAQSVVYPCFCTRREIVQEIEAMSHAPHGPEGALYPGICRELSRGERDARIRAGEAHCWRLDAHVARERTGELVFEDISAGQVNVDPFLLGDVVLARKDIATSYHLAVVVDDGFQGITHVTRGEDLLASTHVHRTLQFLLELPVPVYHHHRLILDSHGKRLAKRHDALSIHALRDQGKLPGEVFLLLDSFSS